MQRPLLSPTMEVQGFIGNPWLDPRCCLSLTWQPFQGQLNPRAEVTERFPPFDHQP